MTVVEIVAAIGRNGAIGYQGRLPWHFPEDLKRFRLLTMGHVVVMGRRTYESLPNPLPGRVNIVVTSTPVPPPANLLFAAPEVVSNLGAAVVLAATFSPRTFIIGGARLLQEALPFAERLHITDIDFDVPADTFWTPDTTGFRLTERVSARSMGATFSTWERAS